MENSIYIAEDEEKILETVQTFLESEGYRVRGFDNGDALFAAFLEEPCDLVILDVLMPGSTGFQITKKIREISTVPIIILTARDSELDYATGINLGSDDYFTKPFSAMSLVMRVKALFRRVRLDRQELQEGRKGEGGELLFGDLRVNRRTKEVWTGRGEALPLTPTEYNVLLYLLENRDRAVSRDELLDKVWGYGKDVETRACDDTVRRLRKKLEDTQVRVETVWGFGFILKEAHP
ncbi:response regulator transcription factor [Anaerotalea alkaliphila]|uniref:Stage 0 sporulation protein A homolog n=1 Tax=Anaerotalea alkaliphila TaxID=2662126 RepID=A0A7X5HV01_9FIRM|nr:response regulator transcription factor [Anaerotalea alkaliphila]NDL67131.1 response regulator transcription factor [Anaerotalea alkaliphila]